MDPPSASIPQNINGPCAAIQQPATPAKMSVKEPSRIAQDIDATFGISPECLPGIPLIKTPPSSQHKKTVVCASSPPSRPEKNTASVTSPFNQHIVTSPSQRIMASAIKTDIFGQETSPSTEHALTPVQGSLSDRQFSIPPENQSSKEVVAAIEITSLDQILKQTSPNMISVEQSLPGEQFMNPAKVNTPSQEASHCIAEDIDATFGISPDCLRDISLVKTPPPGQLKMTAVCAPSPSSKPEEISTASITSTFNQHIVTSPSQQIMASANKTDIFGQESSLSTEPTLTPVQGSLSDQQVSIPPENQSSKEVVAAIEMTSLNQVLQETSPNMIPVEQSLPGEEFMNSAKVNTPSQEASHCIAEDIDATFGISPDCLRDIDITLVKTPPPGQLKKTAVYASSPSKPEEISTASDTSTFNQNIVTSPKAICPSQQTSLIKTDIFGQEFSLSSEHALTPVQGSSSDQQVSISQENQFNQQVVAAIEMTSLNHVLKQTSPNMIPVEQSLPCEEFMTPVKVNTPSQEDTFSDNQQHLLRERLSPADEHAGNVTKLTSPNQQAMTSVKETSKDKMTFLNGQFMKGHLTSPCSFLASSPILQESSSSSAFNIFGSFQEDLSTPTRLEHQPPTFHNDTLEESERLNLCSSEPMKQDVTSAGLNDQRLMNTEDQTLEQLINALGDGGDGDSQAFGKAQEEIKTTSEIAGRSVDHSQNACPTDQFGLLSFQDELNSPLINFCPGTPDTLTDPELSKNELSDAETLDASSSERRRKLYSKRKHDSRQPQVDVASGVDWAKNGKSEIDVRSDVYERPTAQQIELALGVTSGQAEGQLVSTESGSQYMVVGGQVLEILGSGGNIVQTNIEEQHNENNKWISVDRKELDTLVTALDYKKPGFEDHQVQTKSTTTTNATNDLEAIEDIKDKDKGDECPKNFEGLVHDTRELRPTEGLMSRKERDERIKNLRASREEAQLGKSTNTLNNIELSSSECIGKVKANLSTCKTPPENQNKSWIGTKGNYIPKTPSPIKEVIHSAPYGIGRTQIDGQDKLVVLKNRLPTKDSGIFKTKYGGRFDYDLRPTEGLMAQKKDRGTINDYEQNNINKTTHCGSRKAAVKSDDHHDDEGMESNENKKLDSKSSMYMDTQNDFDNISNDSSDSTGMANSFDQTEGHSISFKTSVAQIDEIKLANTDTQNHCSSKAVDRNSHKIGTACENRSHEPFHSDAIRKEETISANVISQGQWNHLNNGTYANCNSQADTSDGMQPYSNNDAHRTELQQRHKMNHHSNITHNTGSCQPQTQTNWSPVNGRSICEDNGGQENFQINSNPGHGGGLVTSTMDSNLKQDPIQSNYRNEGSNISKHPSNQNYQPFVGHMGRCTMNHNATVNFPSVPQQNPTYNGYASKPFPDHYGQGASYRSMYSNPSQGASYRSMYSYPHQLSYFPQSYAQYYPQMYHQYLRYQSQLRYQMQLKQWYNSYYQRGAQWYNSFYPRSGQSYHNSYSNYQYYKYYYPHGFMPNSQNGSGSFQGSYQNPMYQASNSSINQQAPLGNPMNEVGSNNPANVQSHVFQDDSAEFRGDDISQNLIPFTSLVDNGNIAEETNEGKEGQINYPEKEDNNKDLVAHQEIGNSEFGRERYTSKDSEELDENASSDIPNVQDQTNEMANIQFIKDDDNNLLQNISTQSIGLEIDSRKRTSSNLQEDFPSFSNDHSSGSSIGESSSKKRCLQMKEMEFPFTLNSVVEGVETESSKDYVANEAPEDNFSGLPISPIETDASVLNEVGSLNKNDASVVNEEDLLKKADASVVNEVKIFSRYDVNIFGEAPLLPRSEVGSVIESTTNKKNEEEAECFDMNGVTMTNSPPGNLNNFASRRRPRSTYSKKMLDLLMREYVRSPYLTAGARSRLADQLAISEDRILIWFKNQRSKDRTLKKKVSTEGGSDKEVMGAEKRDIVNEVLYKEGIDNFDIEQLVKLDSNSANMVIHLQSDHGNQTLSINCNPGTDVGNNSDQLCSLESNAENEEIKDDYDDNSIEVSNNGINAHEENKNQTDEESKLDSNMNWMFLASESNGFENNDQMDHQAISNDTDNKNSQKIDEQLGMNENGSSYFQYNGDQAIDMIGDYGVKTNKNENADTDLSHEQLEQLFSNIDGEGPRDDQCIGDYEFDFNFDV